LKGITREISG
jgi:hypothetical protein